MYLKRFHMDQVKLVILPRCTIEKPARAIKSDGLDCLEESDGTVLGILHLSSGFHSSANARTRREE
jgi:hypothetical protein